MSYLALWLVVFSALMHSSYNFAFKRSNIKIIYLWSMFTVSVTIMTSLALFLRYLLFVNLKTIVLAAVAAVFFSLYQIYTGKAYALSRGDLSIVYPLSITAPLYIPFLAYFIIGEKIVTTTFGGIILALIGTYLLQMNVPLSNLRIRKIDVKQKHIRYAIFAGFIYSFGAIVDKVGVGRNNFFLYTYWLVMFMFFYMTVNILRNPGLRSRMLFCYRRSALAVLAGGLLMTLSFLSYRYGMELAKVSAVVGVRQISSLFGVLMGTIILKEPYGSLRFFATLLVVLGVVLIKVG